MNNLKTGILLIALSGLLVWLGSVLGGDLLGKLTQQTGMGQSDLLGQLSQLLPQMVDKATPDGAIPAGGLGDIGAILGKLGGLGR